MQDVTIGDWTVTALTGALPQIYDLYREHAELTDEIGLDDQNGNLHFLAVRKTGAGDWPRLVIAQRYTPHEAGFHPGCLIVPETQKLFVGAGTRLIAYDLAKPERLWMDETECGFHAWSRHGDTVVMAAETELAVWSSKGAKLWSTFADPPWDFEISGASVKLDDCGGARVLRLSDGQAAD